MRGSFLGGAQIPDLASVQATDRQLNSLFGTSDIPRFAIIKDGVLDVEAYFKNFGLQHFLTTDDGITTLNHLDNWHQKDCIRSYADCQVVLRHVFHIQYDQRQNKWTEIPEAEWDIAVEQARLPVLERHYGGQK